MELREYGNYQEFKEKLDNEMREASERFVHIGWLLRQALETDILKESGYANVNEFAQKEYGLDKTQVSRFININMRFSEDGNSPRLKEQYRGTGYAKLALMLSLPDEINEEIAEGYSKSEIQAVKEEVEKESKVTDLEVWMEGRKPEQESMETNLDRVIHQLGEDEPELYEKLHGCVAAGVETVKDVLAPDGEKIYFVRIRGVGRKMLSLKADENTVTVIDIRSQEKERYTWEMLLECVQKILKPELAAGDSWEDVYGKGFPKKAEVAPVQPKEEKAPQARKEKKVQKAKEPEKPKEKKHEPEKKEEKSSGAAASEPEREDHTGEQGSTEDDGAVSQEVMMVNSALQWLEAARDIFLPWKGSEIPLEELQAARRKTERFLSILDELIRRKTEGEQLEGQMSIEDVIQDEE